MDRVEQREKGIISVVVRKLLSYLKEANVNIWNITYPEDNVIKVEYIIPKALRSDSQQLRHIVNEDSLLKQMRRDTEHIRMPYKERMDKGVERKKGYKLSEETKEKMRIAARARNAKKYGKMI